MTNTIRTSGPRTGGARPDDHPTGPAAPSDPLLPAAVSAASEVRDEIVRLSGALGRAGVILALRRCAHALRDSFVADDHVRCAAYDAAADDLACGRSPLVAWAGLMGSPPDDGDRSRSDLRARLPGPTGHVVKAAAAAAREIERRSLEEAADLLRATRSLPDQLEAASLRQEAAVDDPRLKASPFQRAVMRVTAGLLREEAQRLRAPFSLGLLGSLGASWWRSVRGGRGLTATRS